MKTLRLFVAVPAARKGPAHATAKKGNSAPLVSSETDGGTGEWLKKRNISASRYWSFAVTRQVPYLTMPVERFEAGEKRLYLASRINPGDVEITR
jgi:hypothetical protein